MAILNIIGVLVAATAVGIYLARPFFEGGVCTSTARLDGKVAIVTGANTGLGKETARDFLERGARVYLACRSLERCNAAARDILQLTGAPENRAIIMELDLADLASVRRFAAEFKKRESSLHILMNNAGVMALPERQESKDGFELQFATNHLGHFLLTHLLLDVLASSAPSRVVTVSSLAHMYWPSIQWDDINLETHYNGNLGNRAYTQSKLANVMFSYELGKRLEGTGVTTYSLHPGVILTELMRHMHPVLTNPVSQWIMSWFTKSIEGGAQTQICCAVDEALASETGKYYSDVAEKAPLEAALVDEDCERLWDLSAKMVKLTEAEIPQVLKK